jgi:transcriptional regulator with XRE-family HTH domain
MVPSTEKYRKGQSETFGAFIRAARERCGFSLSEAGEHLKCTKGYVLRLEQGKANNPTIDTLANMAQAYDIDLAEIAARAAAYSPNAASRKGKR